jgi:enoyl-CoA hydratase/carnithine racemase
MTASLLTERRNRVLVLTIDRPARRNAIDPATLAALTATLTAASADDAVGAAVLTGAGAECFSSGMDLRAVGEAAGGSIDIAATIAGFHALLAEERRIPVVAAVRGSAVGGGVEVMLRCEFVVASAQARFTMPEVGRGLVPGGGSLQWPSLMPLQLANELILLGESLTAERAHALGIVNRVVPDEDVLTTAVGLAERLAAAPPNTLRRARALLAQTAAAGAAASAEALRALRSEDLLSPEALAGLTSFLGKGTTPES